MSTFPSFAPRGRLLFAFILSFVIWVAPNCNGGVAAKTAGAINFAFLTSPRSTPRNNPCLPPFKRRIGSSFYANTVCAFQARYFHEERAGGGGGEERGIYTSQSLGADLRRTLFCASLGWIRCCKMAGCALVPQAGCN